MVMREAMQQLKENKQLQAPLPLYMGMVMLSSMSSLSALKHAKNAWQQLNPQGRKNHIENQSHENLLKEASNQNDVLSITKNLIEKRIHSLLKGIEAYNEHPYRRIRSERNILWQDGTTKLYDYAFDKLDNTKPFILCIPSLINRSYIFDLKPERSFLEFFASKGFHPLLLDWDEPGEMERSFSLEDYINRILQIIDHLSCYNKPITLLGYCMGGVMALAAARLSCTPIKGLVLLATPWDFHADGTDRIALGNNSLESLSKIIKSSDILPKTVIQALFYSLKPWAVHEKFMRFSNIDPNSPEAIDFVALEHWLNDGVGLVSKVAHECFLGWAGKNILMNNEWIINSKIIRPEEITIKTFTAVPNEDTIVPPKSAIALHSRLPFSTLHTSDTGHIGMMVGRNAETLLWNPLAKWIGSL